MITEKQKKFILNNIDLLDTTDMEEIIEKLIDNMTKEYATGLVKNMIDRLKDLSGDYENIEDCGDR